MHDLVHASARVLMRCFAASPPWELGRADIEWLMGRFAHGSAVERAYVLARVAALAHVMRLADAVLPRRGRVLDVGCGYGQVAEWVAREPGREVWGVDASPRRIEVARSGPNRRAKFVCGSAEEVLEQGVWDGILCLDVLSCLTGPEQSALLRQAAGSARSSAVLVIKDSTTSPAWKLAFAQAEERLRGAFGQRMGAASRAITYRSMAEWGRLLPATGWRIVRMETCGKWAPYPGWVGVCQSGDAPLPFVPE
jgi:2-polyprenyl-3-methyl-5-hydroxy-6-metoxy-1,4-benzoquinol methylase